MNIYQKEKIPSLFIHSIQSMTFWLQKESKNEKIPLLPHCMSKSHVKFTISQTKHFLGQQLVITGCSPKKLLFRVIVTHIFRKLFSPIKWHFAIEINVICKSNILHPCMLMSDCTRGIRSSALRWQKTESESVWALNGQIEVKRN